MIRMKFQRFPWSCGAASVVNAFKHFGVNIDEMHVHPVAGTTAPKNCAHCRELARKMEERSCKGDRWKCRCKQCKEVRKLLRSDDCDEGTGHDGILTALRHFGSDYRITAKPYESNDKSAAWQWLHGTLIHGRVAILCLDSWRHWALAYGTSGTRVILFDPGNANSNRAENGQHSLKKGELMRRWWNARHWVGKEKRLYAISVGEK